MQLIHGCFSTAHPSCPKSFHIAPFHNLLLISLLFSTTLTISYHLDAHWSPIRCVKCLCHFKVRLYHQGLLQFLCNPPCISWFVLKYYATCMFWQKCLYLISVRYAIQWTKCNSWVVFNFVKNPNMFLIILIPLKLSSKDNVVVLNNT